jgi:SAM-dependent methyltransferase
MPVHRLYTEYAALYDAAFDWDVSGQVESICGLSGITKGRVLEPMCGSGRLARGFAAAGFATIGVDTSREMLQLAAQRFAQAGLVGEWIEADVTDFDLDEGCHLAICPINSLAHLPSAAAMEAHLNAVARNLFAGGSYWLQLDLKHADTPFEPECWDFDYRGETLRFEWACLGYNDGFETHRSRIVFPDGRSVEETHEMKSWSFDSWTALLSLTRFDLSGAYANDTFTPLPVSKSLDGRHVFWQQLVKSG